MTVMATDYVLVAAIFFAVGRVSRAGSVRAWAGAGSSSGLAECRSLPERVNGASHLLRKPPSAALDYLLPLPGGEVSPEGIPGWLQPEGPGLRGEGAGLGPPGRRQICGPKQMTQ